MEENHNLLSNIFRKRYIDIPHKLDKINALVEEYSKNNENRSSYEKVLNLLHGTISNDVPQNILLYFLTTIPLPKENIESNDDSNSDLFSLMQKSRITLPESINNSLHAYLNELINNESKSDHNKNSKLGKRTVNVVQKRCKPENGDDDGIFLKPKKKSKLPKKMNNPNEINLDNCKSLLDITAQYVVSKFNQLNNFYKKKNEMVWNILHKNPCHDDAQNCFAVLKDVNKKRKWLRMIDSNNISPEILKDEFKESFKIFRKLNKPETESRLNAFKVSDELKNAIMNYINC